MVAARWGIQWESKMRSNMYENWMKTRVEANCRFWMNVHKKLDSWGTWRGACCKAFGTVSLKISHASYPCEVGRIICKALRAWRAPKM